LREEELREELLVSDLFFGRPDTSRPFVSCALRSDDTEAIWSEASDVPSIGSSCASRQQLDGTGGYFLYIYHHRHVGAYPEQNQTPISKAEAGPSNR
jgi:hypothetical protein